MARISLRQLLDHAAEHGYGLPAFGGFAPLIVTWRIAVTGSKLAPSFSLTPRR